MEKTLTDMLSWWPAVVFCLAIYMITVGAKRIVSRLLTKHPRATWWWHEVILPAFPIALGALLAALMTKYPWPPSVTSTGFRVLIGVVCGGGNTLVYRIIKSIVKKNYAVEEDKEVAVNDGP